MARLVLLLASLVPAVAAVAQGAGNADPEKVAPQVIVNVRKHPVGADMVDITAAAADYPFDLMRSQAEAIARNLGSEARGLSVYASAQDPKFKFVKASFATDGIIDRATGAHRLSAIVKAFLGAPAKYETRSLIVLLEGEKPVDKQTLQSFSSASAVVKARPSAVPVGIEYRILALTQDPGKIDIPDRYVEQAPQGGSSVSRAAPTPGPLVWSLVAVAGAAAGALVYFWAAGRSSRARNRPARRT